LIECCRFVLPVLPVALMFSGYCLAAMAQFKGKNLHGRRCLSRLQLSVILLIITNVPMALYMSLFHQVSFFYANIILASYCSMAFFCCFSVISIYVSYATFFVAERNGRCYVLFVKRSPWWKSEECPLSHALSFNTLLLYLALQRTYALFGLHS
jgi:hypothetical protein